MPDPEVRDNDVLIQIHAASINPLDTKIKAANSNQFFATAFS